VQDDRYSRLQKLIWIFVRELGHQLGVHKLLSPRRTCHIWPLLCCCLAFITVVPCVEVSPNPSRRKGTHISFEAFLTLCVRGGLAGAPKRRSVSITVHWKV
jgi:hypothetical protein